MTIRSNPTVLSLLVLDPFKIGGMEMFTRELSRQLGTEGWDSVLCFTSKPPAEVREYLELPNVRLLSLPERSKNSPHPRDFLNCLCAIKPQILHLHFTGVVNPLPWLAYFSGVGKIFYTDHVSRPAGPYLKRPIYKRWAARAITWPLTNQIAVSKYVQRHEEREGYVSPKKLVQIYNGVDFRRVSDAEVGASFRNRLGIPSNAFIVLLVCNLIPEKGVGLLISALRMALPRNPLLHAVVVGSGSEKSNLMEFAQQCRVAHHVSFVPASEDPFGDGVFAAADLFCLPSVWEEACALTLTEAMAHGKPVVATRVGGTPEIVEDGVTGVLVERNDVPGLAERTLQLAGDSELRNRLGQAAERTVRQRFDLTERVSELLQVYGIRASNTQAMVKTAEPETVNASPNGIREHTYWLTPLFPLSQAAWIRIFGFSILRVRLPVILVGFVLLAAWYAIVFRLSGGNRKLATLAVSLIVIDITFIVAATRARPRYVGRCRWLQRCRRLSDVAREVLITRDACRQRVHRGRRVGSPERRDSGLGGLAGNCPDGGQREVEISDSSACHDSLRCRSGGMGMLHSPGSNRVPQPVPQQCSISPDPSSAPTYVVTSRSIALCKVLWVPRNDALFSDPVAVAASLHRAVSAGSAHFQAAGLGVPKADRDDLHICLGFGSR